MEISKTTIAGVLLVDINPTKDDRGLFARTWDPAIAKRHGLLERFDYSCISGNTANHTLRGMHWQKHPHGETKLIRCTKGAMFDVAVDLRPESRTFRQWFGVELTADNHRALYIPAGCAHGFMTLMDDTEVLYMIAGIYTKEAECGMRWDDPAVGIRWPSTHPILSERDRSFSLLSA